MRRKRPHKQSDGSSYWQSYSDMMAALLLMFVLLLAFAMFNAADTYEKKQVEILNQRTKLSSQTNLLSTQEEQLLLQQKKLEEQTAALAGHQERMSHQAELLKTQQGLLDTQQSKLQSQQSLLVEQQMMIEDIIGVRTRLIKQISDRLRQEGIQAQIDKTTGAITFGSNVLFEFNKEGLTKDGDDFLAKFLPVYFGALLNSGFDDYVSEIIIEGHTDTTGNYMYNLELSQQRAFAVASFALDEKNKLVDDATLQKLRSIVTANGRSWSNPILTSDNKVDMDASRRVEIKFRLRDEDMVKDMKSIIEGDAP